MSDLTDFTGSTLIWKETLLTIGTSWSIPAKLYGDAVKILAAIAGGGGGDGAGLDPGGGDSGEYIQEYWFDLSSHSGTVTYAIGAAGAASTDGGDTTFGDSAEITLEGGKEGGTDSTSGGAKGGRSASSALAQPATAPPGPYGGQPGRWHTTSKNPGAGGLHLDDTQFGGGAGDGTGYGAGGEGDNTGAGSGKQGAILLGWWELP